MSFDLDRPEGMLGSILAFEGIKDAMVVVNGPTGCKYYPASASESSYRNRPEGPQTYNPYRYQREFFFSQPRVPCTYMDGNDYIMGTRGRLDKAMDAVAGFDPRIVGAINSPGASLIGEDLSLNREPEFPIIRMESPDYSVSMGEGFQNALISILDTTSPKISDERRGVNLIGISVWHLGWFDSLNDIKELLALCDIEVNAVVSAGCGIDEIMDSGKAELNIVVHEEFGLKVAEWYRSELGIEYINSGTPIGFDAVETFIGDICKALGKDPEKALNRISEKRKRTANVLSCLSASRRLPRGRTFSISADGSTTLQICRFLYDYLGMIPVALNTGLDRTHDIRINDFLCEHGLDVSDDVLGTECDVMISNGNMISAAMYRGIVNGGAAVERPGIVNMNVEERPVLGLGGTVRLVDSVLNALERSGRSH